MRTPSLVLTVAACLLAGAASVAAQPLSAFSDLQLKVKTGDTVTVRDTGGRTVRGRVNALTPSALTIDTSSGQERFTAANLRELAVAGDSVRNGALIGLCAGGALGAVSGGSFSGEFRGADAAQGAVFFGAIGAGLGALADKLIHGTTLVYKATPGVAVAPIITRGGFRMAARIAW